MNRVLLIAKLLGTEGFVAESSEMADAWRRIPKIVCLCGSTRFKDAFVEANRTESMAGHIVLTVADGATEELHKRKIDLCDEVLVLNVGGYVGKSTRSEIEYALQQQRPVRWLEVRPCCVCGQQVIGQGRMCRPCDAMDLL